MVVANNKASDIRVSLFGVLIETRSQAGARIADRTASQHLRRSRDVIGHVTI